ncbi:hypothetical protein GC207_07580 [bacterium]|nr:hypothetical protein [bacterium]
MKTAAFSRYVRRIHMYLALFLTPWILMYALSSLVFNHLGTIRGWYGGNLNQFQKVDEIEYKDAFSDDAKPEDMAKQILLDLNLDGAHFVPANSTADHLVITRQSPFVMKRITYQRTLGKLIVERQEANLPSILVRMHTRHGYEQDYASMTFWGLGVELTVLAMLFWIASGLWLWWEIKPARKYGAAFMLVGLGLFAVMLFAI